MEQLASNTILKMDEYFYAKISQLTVEQEAVNDTYKIIASAYNMSIEKMLGHQYKGRSIPEMVIEARATMHAGLRRLGYDRPQIARITNWSVRTVNRGLDLHKELLEKETYQNKWRKIEYQIDTLNGWHDSPV
jgi:hypothetical protein